MSPFGQLLHELRQKSGLRQVELAERMGYEQSYLSALELGVKGPPPTEFIDEKERSMLEAFPGVSSTCATPADGE